MGLGVREEKEPREGEREIGSSDWEKKSCDIGSRRGDRGEDEKKKD